MVESTGTEIESSGRLGAILGVSVPETHRQMYAEAKQFADEVLMPAADLHDREESFPESQVNALAEKGFLGILAPEQYGGMGLDNLALTLALEEINRGCASTGVTLSVHNSLLSSPLLHFGTEEQKERFFPGLASGKSLGAYAITAAFSAATSS